MADQLLLMRQPEPPCRSSAGNDQRLRVHLLFAQVQQKRPLAEIGAGEVGHAVFGAEPLRLFSHVLYQLRAQNTLRKAGKILDQRGQGELAAGLVALYHQRFQVGARRVQCGSVSGAAGSDDDDFASFAHSSCESQNLDGRFQIWMQGVDDDYFFFCAGLLAGLRMGSRGFDGLVIPATLASSSGTVRFTPSSLR